TSRTRTTRCTRAAATHPRAAASRIRRSRAPTARASGNVLVRRFDVFEQQQRDGLLQTLHAARLVEERLVGPERHLLLEQAIAEAGEVEHLQRRVLDAEAA